MKKQIKKEEMKKKINLIGVSGKKQSGKDLVGKIIQYLIRESFLQEQNFYTENKVYEKYTLLEIINKTTWGIKSLMGWEIKKFADKLKDMVCLIIGCTRADLENEEFKNKELGEQWSKWRISCSTEYHTEEKFFSTKNECLKFKEFETSWLWDEPILIKLTPRLLLQLLGTECGRNIIHPNIWVNSLFSEYNLGRKLKVMNGQGLNIDTTDNWIITDVRFPNELEAIKSRGGISIRVNRHQIIKHSENASYQFNPILDKQHESEKALDLATFDYIIDNNGTIEELVEKVKAILIKEGII